MKRFSLALWFLLAVGPAWAQEPTVYQPEGANTSFQFRGDEGVVERGGALFAAPGGVVGSGGLAGGGLGLSGIGNIQFGFQYLRPTWSFRDFTLAVPAANAGNFPVLGDTGHVDSQFALSPKVDYNYYFTNLEFGIKASGTFLNLNGQLKRDVLTNGVQGKLEATSNLTMVVANLIEFRKHIELEEWSHGKSWDSEHFRDLLIDVSIGTRYSSIVQNYTGSLSNGLAPNANVTTRFSNQDFDGIGLTASANFAKEMKRGSGWFCFADTRGSILVGDNNRSSSLTVTLGNVGATTTISETETEFIPILELETGLQWQTEVGPKVIARSGGVPQRLFILRTSLVCQYWANVGPLSAGSDQAFRDSDLYLLGATVMAGFSF